MKVAMKRLFKIFQILITRHRPDKFMKMSIKLKRK